MPAAGRCNTCQAESRSERLLSRRLLRLLLLSCSRLGPPALSLDDASRMARGRGRPSRLQLALESDAHHATIKGNVRGPCALFAFRRITDPPPYIPLFPLFFETARNAEIDNAAILYKRALIIEEFSNNNVNTYQT